MILLETGRGAAKGGGGGGRQLPRPEVVSARKLRRTMSLPEVMLWERLRRGRVGAKIRRRHPIGPYVSDFSCSAVRLAIEIGGEGHDRGERIERDRARDAFFEQNGYQVRRVAAVDVTKDPDRAATGIADNVAELARVTSPLHRFAVPLPAGGEDI